MALIQPFTMHTITNDDNGIAEAQDPAAAGALTLDGALVSGGVARVNTAGTAQQVRIFSAGDDTGLNFVVTGEDADGAPLVSMIGGGNAGAVLTVHFFSAVSQVWISGNSAGNVYVGWLATEDTVSKTIHTSWRHIEELGVQVSVEQGQVVTITSAGDDTGITYTPTGTRRGKLVQDSITGANTGTATGTVLFDNVNVIETDGDSGVVTAGSQADADGIATSHDPGAAADLTFGNSAYTTTSNELAEMPSSLTYSVEYTLDTPGEAEQPNWIGLTDMTGKTATDAGNAIVGVQGLRLRFTTYVSGSAIITVLQRSR